MQNEAQYDLHRKAAKISALFSNNLDKYEYLTGEDLGLKPNTIEQVRFEYSLLGKIFNKGLSDDDKEEGLFKRLTNIENAQRILIKNDDKDNAAYGFTLKSVNEFIEEITSMEEKINLSLFEEFFESSSPTDYAKMLINTKNADENKENVKETENRILDLEDRIKEMNEKEKK